MIWLEEFNFYKLVQKLISFFPYFVQLLFGYHQKKIRTSVRKSLGAMVKVFQIEQLTFLVKSLRFKLMLLSLVFGSKAYHMHLETLVNTVHSFLKDHLYKFFWLKYDLGLEINQWFNLLFPIFNTYVIPY